MLISSIQGSNGKNMQRGGERRRKEEKDWLEMREGIGENEDC